MKLLAPLMVTLSGFLFFANTSFAVDGQMVAAVQQGRQYESAGQWVDAGQTYYNAIALIHTGNPDEEIAKSIGRRAVACLTRAANGGDKQQSDLAKQYIGGYYRAMYHLEPNNPTWAYLLAQWEFARGAYLEGRSDLQAAINDTGGSASVKDKARKLLAHTNAFAGADSSRVAASTAARARGVNGSLSHANGDNVPHVRARRDMPNTTLQRINAGTPTDFDRQLMHQ